MEDIELRILAKRRELQSLQLLNSQILTMTSNFEHLQTNMADLASGTESVSEIMNNWQSILKSITMANLSIQKYSSLDYDNFESTNKIDNLPLPETLVRIKMDK